MAVPTFVSETGLLSDIDSKFSEKIEFYAPYIRQEKRFLQADDEIARITNVAVTQADVHQMLAHYIGAMSLRSGQAVPAAAHR